MKIRSKLKSVLFLALALAAFSACQPGSGTGVQTSEQPSTEAPTTPGNKEQPLIAPSAPTASPDKSAQEPRPQKSMLVVSGGGSFGSTGLYVLSSTAREAIPTRFSGYSLEYTQPQPLPKPGRVMAIARQAYARNDKDELHLINLSTDQSYPVYSTEGSILTFAVSPDGLTVALSELPKDARTGARIRLLDLNGNALPQFATGMADAQSSEIEPQFSPDGEALSFERQGNGSSSLVIVPLIRSESSKAITIAEAGKGERVSSLRFAANRNTYAYLRHKSGQNRLVVATEGQPESVIDTIEGSVHEPVWAPNGKSIAFWSDSIDAQELQVLHAGDKTATPIATITIARGREEIPVCPAWSTDSKQIYYTSRTDSWEGIFSVSLEDRRVSRLSDPVLPISFFCPRVLPAQKSTLEENSK